MDIFSATYAGFPFLHAFADIPLGSSFNVTECPNGIIDPVQKKILKLKKKNHLILHYPRMLPHRLQLFWLISFREDFKRFTPYTPM